MTMIMMMMKTNQRKFFLQLRNVIMIIIIEDLRQKRQILVDSNQAHDQQEGGELALATVSDQDQQAEPLNHHDSPQALEAPNQASSEHQQQHQRGKRTLYACEGKQLQIECQLDEYIQLIRANYGRFSIGKCNDHGQLDWKVNCMSPTSFKIITSR